MHIFFNKHISAKCMYSVMCVAVCTDFDWYLFKMGMLNGVEIAYVTRIYLEGGEHKVSHP